MKSVPGESPRSNASLRASDRLRALRLKSSTHLIHPRDLPGWVYRHGLWISLPSNTGFSTLEIPKYSGADSTLRLIQFLLQYKANFAFTNQVEETSQLWSDQLSSTELGNQQRQQLERTILSCSALVVENFSTPQTRFREGYREIPHDARRTSEMSNAKQFNDVSTTFDGLGRRKCRLFTF